MKFVNSSDKIDEAGSKTILELGLNKLGQPVRDKSERVFATILTISRNDDENDRQSRYGILTLNNQPYDPYGIDSHRESTLNLQLKQVNQQTYNYYTSYLQTKNKLFLTRTQRSFING